MDTSTKNQDLSGLMPVSVRPSALMVRGQGAWLFDADGKRYLDFVQGWAVNSFGHCPALVRDALAQQAEKLVNASPGYHTLPQHTLATALCAALGLDHAFFTTSGAEANEGAIKLARKWGQLKRNGAYEIITTQGSFHGRTLATMAASGKPGFDALFPPSVPGFVKVPFGDVAAVANAIHERTVAVMLEPIQGEAGVVVPPDGYLRELRALTTERGVLLMLDEVQVGMGRTGKLLACQHEGVLPDVLTLGKGLGAGVPLGALLARREVSCFAPGDQGGTFAGHPLMTAVGLAVLHALQLPGFLEGVQTASDYMRAGLRVLAQRYGACEVRGRGLLLALTLPAARGKQVVDAALGHGLLINSPRPELLRFMPALNVTHEEIDRMLALLDLALRDGLEVNDLQTLDTTEECIDAILARVGRNVMVGTPLGIGKPNHLLNALYRRAKADQRIQLHIHTALSLVKPRGESELERRFMQPMVERVFGNYPDLEYELDRQAGVLPRNVRVIEFYFPAGAYLNNPGAQRDYISSNYTHVARDLHARGVNVLMQQVCAGVVDGRPMLSLSCNPDVSLDLAAKLRADEKLGKPIAIVAQLNDQLPFMYGDAVVAPDVFDYVVDNPNESYALFAPPKLAVTDVDHMIGLHASTLVKDGGELQVGIGALGDAIVYALQLRHEQNALYHDALNTLGVAGRSAEVIARLGDTKPFTQGLFSATEMLVDGFMHLFDAGILKRKVYDDVALSRLLNEGRIDERITRELLDLLRARRAIRGVLTEADFGYLQHFGILKRTLRWDAGDVVLPDGTRIRPDIDDRKTRALLDAHLGDTLEHGAVIHAGFFVGPNAFYDWLRKLPEARRKLIDMRSVTRINQLYGHEEIDRLHRRDARFVNTAMMITLLGSTTSDALEDGRVVSGVGGQYNFVAMAHELPGGRSALQVRSTRMDHGQLRSNIVWSYGHTTIPRHLRDLVITEYGIADLRAKTDEECIEAMLCIADSRFQLELQAQAKRHGKLRAEHEIPAAHRNNFPATYAKPMAALRSRGLFPVFPFGTDLNAQEQTLGRALRTLQSRLQTRTGTLKLLGAGIANGSPGPDVDALVQRMQLDAANTPKQRVYRRLLSAALRLVS